MHRPLLLPAFAALVLGGCTEGKSEGGAPAPERPVLVQQVRFGPTLPARGFVGTVRPRIESDLGFRVTGKVLRRLVSVGDEVRAGQVLAILDDADLRLQWESAGAERRAARSALANSEAEERRALDLRRQGWSTDAVSDRVRAATEEARGRVERAERAALLAQNGLSYATLQADADGLVTAVMVEPGQVIEAGAAAIRVARHGERDAVVALPETLIEDARRGRARVELWSDPGRTYEARLRELAPAADPATRTYAARFTILDAGDAVRLGMTATVTITREGERPVARLPLSAVLDEGRGPAVFVVDRETGALQRRAVDILSFGAREVAVAKGVGEGEWVVALGVQKIDAAQRVRVVETPRF